MLRWREIAVVKVIRGPRRHRPTISVGFVECHDVIQTHFTEFDWYISELGGWGGAVMFSSANEKVPFRLNLTH